MVTRSAAKQKMESLSRYKPGFLTLKHGERAMRQAWHWLQDWLPDQHMFRGTPAFKVPDFLVCLPGTKMTEWSVSRKLQQCA